MKRDYEEFAVLMVATTAAIVIPIIVDIGLVMAILKLWLY